jgi:hypothetical protein
MTASSTDADAAEDVNDFLLRIRELGEKRDQEDEARTKKLEEDILQGRKERQARRAGTPVVLCLFLPSLCPLSSAAAFPTHPLP